VSKNYTPSSTVIKEREEKTLTTKKRGQSPHISTYWKFPGTLDYLHIYYRFWDGGIGDHRVRYTV